MGLNPRILAVLIMIGFFAFLLFGGNIMFPNKDKVKPNLTPNITVITKIVTQIVTVTPTPDGHTYFASEYQNGTRLMQRPFSFIRYNAMLNQNANRTPFTDNESLSQQINSYNSSNLVRPELTPDGKDMKITTIVYDYRLFDKLHQFNPETYKYEELTPDDGKQFCMIFVHTFMDDVIGDDTRMWMFSGKSFVVYDGTQSYLPYEYQVERRFREVENVLVFDKSTRIQAYKSFRQYSSLYEHSLSDEVTHDTLVGNAGEINDEIYYLRGGESNAIDGYLLFEIAKEDTPDKLTVGAQFYSFGWSQWLLRLS